MMLVTMLISTMKTMVTMLISTMVLMSMISKVMDAEDDLEDLNVDMQQPLIIVIIIVIIVDITGDRCRR